MPQIFVYDIGLTTSFRGITRRRGMLIQGPAGWAEWSPFEEYDETEAARWLRAALETATVGHPAPLRNSVPVNAIIPAIGPEAAAERVRQAGCTTAKVKVAQAGESLDDDVARVAAVRAALGPEGRIRVDANTAWDFPEALEALRELSQFGLEYAEQPVADVHDMAALRRELAVRDIPVPLAADESIRRARNPLLVRDLAAADVAIIKYQPLGGVTACMDLVEQLGLPAVVSSALDSSIGLHAGVRLAAALPELPYACGLETGSLLLDDVVTNPVRVRDGELAVADVEVDREALERVRADEETTNWWRRRFERASALVDEV